MRILLVSNYFPEHVGGIETIAALLARGYRQNGHEVRWVAADIAGRPHRGHPDDRPFRVWNGIESLGFPYPIPSPGALRRVRPDVEWADVVHIHDSLYALNVMTFVAARRARRPILLTQHVAKVPYPNAAYRALQSAAYATVGRALLSRADQVVFVSDHVRHFFEARVRFRRQAVVVENGIDTDVFAPSAGATHNGAARPLLLFVGRFVEKKGIRLLEPAIAATPEFDWLLIGRSGDVDPSTWGLPNLQVLEPLSPALLRERYAAADLVVLPSSGEGFPVVAQEAMASGTPVLLTETTADALTRVRDSVFTTAAGAAALTLAVKHAVAETRSNPGLRSQVAELASGRWRAAAMVARYEGLLGELVVPRAARQ